MESQLYVGIVPFLGDELIACIVDVDNKSCRIDNLSTNGVGPTHNSPMLNIEMVHCLSKWEVYFQDVF